MSRLVETDATGLIINGKRVESRDDDERDGEAADGTEQEER